MRRWIGSRKPWHEDACRPSLDSASLDIRSPTGAENVLWNLDDLVSPPVAEAVDAALAAADQGMDRLAAKYRGRVARSRRRADARAPPGVRGDHRRWPERWRASPRFPGPRRATIPPAARCCRRSRSASHGLTQKAVFLDIEWANAPEEDARKLIDDPLLSRWRHWLIISRRYKPHLLSEPEEKILAEKSVNGAQAWTRYFDETLASTLFEWEGGRSPQEVILRQLYAADREVRRRAAASLTRGLRGIQRTTTYVFNTLLAEKSSEDRLRRYPTWISSRNMDNQVDDATVDALVAAVTSRYDIVARYYRLKRRLARARRALRLRPLCAPCRGGAALHLERGAGDGACRLRPVSPPHGGDRLPVLRKGVDRCRGSPRQARGRLQQLDRPLGASLHPDELPGHRAGRHDPCPRAGPRRAPVPGPGPGSAAAEHAAHDGGDRLRVRGDPRVPGPHLAGEGSRRSSCPCSCARSNPPSRPCSARWR